MVELILIDEESNEIFANVEIPEELFTLLVDASNKSGKTIEVIINEAIKEGIEREQKKNKSI